MYIALFALIRETDLVKCIRYFSGYSLIYVNEKELYNDNTYIVRQINISKLLHCNPFKLAKASSFTSLVVKLAMRQLQG